MATVHERLAAPDFDGRHMGEESVEQDWKALRLRGEGLTWAQVGEQLGCSATAAYKRVWKAYRRLAPLEADDARDAELARLQLLEDAIWARAMGGDVPAVNTCLRISEQRALLLGVRAPVRVEVDVAVSAHVDAAWERTVALRRAERDSVGGPLSEEEDRLPSPAALMLPAAAGDLELDELTDQG